ncbi:MAG TPA: OFA family MFS transporter [Papillibacter sp.]|nr:OFA family MFS transporter [Papillibacter sp.]
MTVSVFAPKNRKALGGRGRAVLAGLVIQLCVGIIYLWSVFKVPIMNTFGWNLASANMVSSIMMFAFVLGNLLGGYLQDRTNPRRIATIGCLMFSGGIFATALLTARTIPLIYLTYGVVSGLGSGFAYGSVISCIQKWFPNKCGFASGLAVSAFGLSTVVFGPVSQWLMNRFESGNVLRMVGSELTPVTTYNFTAVFAILAGAFFLVTMAACAFLRLPPATLVTPAKEKRPGAQRDLTPRELVRTPAFWLITLNIFFINGAWNLIVPLIKDLGIARGLTTEAAVLTVSLTGLFSAGGRLIMATVSDKIGRIPAILILAGTTFLCAVALIGAGGALYSIAVVLIAFGQGGPSAIHPAIVTDIYGPTFSGTNYGFAMLALGASSVVFNAISNLLQSWTGGYTATFVMAAGASLMPMLLMQLLKRQERKHSNQTAMRPADTFVA